VGHAVATSRKFAGSIPDGVNGNFHRHNTSGRTVVLGSTQPLTEMSTRNMSRGVNHLHLPIVLKSGNINLLAPKGPFQTSNGFLINFIYVFPVCHIFCCISESFSNLYVQFLPSHYISL